MKARLAVGATVLIGICGAAAFHVACSGENTPSSPSATVSGDAASPGDKLSAQMLPGPGAPVQAGPSLPGTQAGPGAPSQAGPGAPSQAGPGTPGDAGPGDPVEIGPDNPQPTARPTGSPGTPTPRSGVPTPTPLGRVTPTPSPSPAPFVQDFGTFSTTTPVGGTITSLVTVSGVPLGYRLVRVRAGFRGSFPNAASFLTRADLTGPDNTIGLLWDIGLQGGTLSGTGYGSSCNLPGLDSFTDPGLTTFDIQPLGFPALSDGVAPYDVTYRPPSLSQSGAHVFRSNTSLNGTWRLRLFLAAGAPAVTMDCWRVEIHAAP